MSRGLAPQINQIVAQAKWTPAAAFLAGTAFGFTTLVATTPLQVYDLTLDPDLTGFTPPADPTADLFWEWYLPTEVGANQRELVLADNAGLLNVQSIANQVGPPTSVLANMLTNAAVRGWR